MNNINNHFSADPSDWSFRFDTPVDENHEETSKIEQLSEPVVERESETSCKEEITSEEETPSNNDSWPLFHEDTDFIKYVEGDLPSKEEVARTFTQSIPFITSFVIGLMEAKRKPDNIQKIITKAPILKEVGESIRTVANDSPTYRSVGNKYKFGIDSLKKLIWGSKKVEDASSLESKEIVEVKDNFVKKAKRSSYLDKEVNTPKQLMIYHPQEKIKIRELLKDLEQDKILLNKNDVMLLLNGQTLFTKQETRNILKTVNSINEDHNNKVTAKSINTVWLSAEALIAGVSQTYFGRNGLKHDQVAQWLNEALSSVIYEVESSSLAIFADTKDFKNYIEKLEQEVASYPDSSAKMPLLELLSEARKNLENAHDRLQVELSNYKTALNEQKKSAKTDVQITLSEVAKNSLIFPLGPLSKGYFSKGLRVSSLTGMKKRAANMTVKAGTTVTTVTAKEITSEVATRQDVQNQLKVLKKILKVEDEVVATNHLYKFTTVVAIDVISKTLAEVSQNDFTKATIANALKSNLSKVQKREENASISAAEALKEITNVQNGFLKIVKEFYSENRMLIERTKEILDSEVNDFKVANNRIKRK